MTREAAERPAPRCRLRLPGLVQRACLAGLVAAAVGCSRRPGEGASEQFEGAIAALRAGSLEQTYLLSVPPAFSDALDGLLRRALALFDEGDFHALRALAESTGQKLPGAIRRRLAGEPAGELIAEKVANLPRILGLESFEAFRGQSVRGVLQSLDREVFSELARLEPIRSRLEGVRVRLLAAEGDWASLRFLAGGRSEQPPLEEVVSVVSVQGRWVPAAWASDWPSRVEELTKEVESLEAEKGSHPERMRGRLVALGLLLTDPEPLLDALLSQLAPGTVGPGQG